MTEKGMDENEGWKGCQGRAPVFAYVLNVVKAKRRLIFSRANLPSTAPQPRHSKTLDLVVTSDHYKRANVSVSAFRPSSSWPSWSQSSSSSSSLRPSHGSKTRFSRNSSVYPSLFFLSTQLTGPPPVLFVVSASFPIQVDRPPARAEDDDMGHKSATDGHQRSGSLCEMGKTQAKCRQGIPRPRSDESVSTHHIPSPIAEPTIIFPQIPKLHQPRQRSTSSSILPSGS